jgi:hypothetical protein
VSRSPAAYVSENLINIGLSVISLTLVNFFRNGI